MFDPFGLAGQVLDGQFRVDRFVGEGGFSVVYRGHHLGLNEPIAIKCLKLPSGPGIALGSALVESFVRRFRDESRLHYRLSQGNLHVVRSMASGTIISPATSALVPYMVLEWLDGRSLADELSVRRLQNKTGRSLPEAIKLLDPAVEAIAYAHAQGVVHRDLSPGNLFLTEMREGITLKVLDFGVAKVVSDHALELGPRAHTIGQIRMFSPVYGAPEQFDHSVGPIGAWTDVYTLVLVLLEVLRDRPVREAEHFGELAALALDPARLPTPAALGLALPGEVEEVLARAVSIDPRARPADAGELWGSLKNAMRRTKTVGVLPAAHVGPEGGSGARVTASTLPLPTSGNLAVASTLRLAAPLSPPPPRLIPSPPPAADQVVLPRPSMPPESVAGVPRHPRLRGVFVGLVVLVFLALALGGAWAVFRGRPHVGARAAEPSLAAKMPARAR